MLPCRVYSVLSGFTPLVDEIKLRLKLRLPTTDANTWQSPEAAVTSILITAIDMICLPTTKRSAPFPATALQWKTIVSWSNHRKWSLQFSIKACWLFSAEDHLLAADTGKRDEREFPEAANICIHAKIVTNFLAFIQQRIPTQAPLNLTVIAKHGKRNLLSSIAWI